MFLLSGIIKLQRNEEAVTGISNILHPAYTLDLFYCLCGISLE